VFGAFSVSLVLMSFLGPAIGRHIDEFGGRKVLVSSAIVLPLGLVLLALAQVRGRSDSPGSSCPRHGARPLRHRVRRARRDGLGTRRARRSPASR
jgi:hypothetical protein